MRRITPELENDMLLELRQNDKDYEQVHEQFYTMEEQYPFIIEVLEGKGRVVLTEEEHAILLAYLALYRKMDEKERIHLPGAYGRAGLFEKDRCALKNVFD